MKRNKRLLVTIALIFTLALGAFAFTACTPSHLFITDSVSFDVQTERQFLGEVLNDLVEEERLEIEYSGSIDDAWGRFFLNIGDLNPSSDEWIGLFSTINNTTYSMMLNPISYNDKTFFSSLRGVDTMPIVKGASYMLLLRPNDMYADDIETSAIIINILA